MINLKKLNQLEVFHPRNMVIDKSLQDVTLASDYDVNDSGFDCHLWVALSRIHTDSGQFLLSGFNSQYPKS